MSLKDQIEELNLKISETEEKSTAFAIEASSLRSDRDSLIAKYILEENILSNTIWTLSASSVTRIDYAGAEKDIEKFLHITNREYSPSIELYNGISIQNHDSDVSISFTDSKKILPFAKKHNLLLDSSSIISKLSKLKREVAALELLVHQFNL